MIGIIVCALLIIIWLFGEWGLVFILVPIIAFFGYFAIGELQERIEWWLHRRSIKRQVRAANKKRVKKIYGRVVKRP